MELGRRDRIIVSYPWAQEEINYGYGGWPSVITSLEVLSAMRMNIVMESGGEPLNNFLSTCYSY